MASLFVFDVSSEGAHHIETNHSNNHYEKVESKEEKDGLGSLSL